MQTVLDPYNRLFEYNPVMELFAVICRALFIQNFINAMHQSSLYKAIRGDDSVTFKNVKEMETIHKLKHLNK